MSLKACTSVTEASLSLVLGSLGGIFTLPRPVCCCDLALPHQRSDLGPGFPEPDCRISKGTSG